MKRCEHPGCGADAKHLVIFEAKLGGQGARLPWRWLCWDHGEGAHAAIAFLRGKPWRFDRFERGAEPTDETIGLFRRFYGEIRRRVLDGDVTPEERTVREAWIKAEDCDQGLLVVCQMCAATELDGELMALAANRGDIGLVKEAHVEVLTPEQALESN